VALTYDNEGRLTARQNQKTSPTATDSFLYDGEENRIEQQSVSGSVTTPSVYAGSLIELRTVPRTAKVERTLSSPGPRDTFLQQRLTLVA
jgi:YD repeat-containing protein